MKLNTTLISGAGNTFHLVEDKDFSFSTSDRKRIAQIVCEKDPADGFIFLKKSLEQFSWHFYNNDGSDAEMCGNATRCVGLFISREIDPLCAEWSLQTLAGQIQIKKLSEDQFQVIMTAITESPSSLGFYCNTGVPHLVLPLENYDNYKKQKSFARDLRNHSSFAPAGTNVTFIQIQTDPKQIKAVSYERGVEDFTQACGTGAMAAAFYNYKKHNHAESSVEMPGGTLIMNVKDLSHPTMTGPAIILGKYQYEF